MFITAEICSVIFFFNSKLLHYFGNCANSTGIPGV